MNDEPTTGIDFLTTTRRKTNDSSGMVTIDFQSIILYLVLIDRCSVGKRLVENNDKIVLEVYRYAAAVFDGVPDYLVFFGDNLHIRTIVEDIDNHIGFIAFGKGETEHDRAGNRRYFSLHIVSGQINLIVIRFSHFGLM